uniref:Cytochrome P450 monooxygenase n=1 Tax=Trametes versicolor TaxID=5325 RepID=A0AA86IXF1_TRAVE|nr:cytochrome P450 monooxygenase [Trametes versicolor]
MAVSLPVLGAIVVLLCGLWHFLQDYFLSSPLDNLPGPASSSLLQGHIQEIFARRGWKFLKDLSERYGPMTRLRGLLGARMLIVYDPKALHSLLIKDADSYPKCSASFDEFMLFLGPSVLTTDGGQHRRQRKQLNPVFSAAHLRNMTHLFYDIAHRVRKALEHRAASAPGGDVVDVNGWMARTTLEMLGQATLGYSFDNFVDDSTDAFGESLKGFFPTYARIALVGFLIPPLSYFLPQRVCRAVLRAIPHADIRKMMHISDTMAQRSLEIINEKKMALLKGDDVMREKVGEGKDLMSILLKANMLASEADRLSDEELIAQMSTFILAGMDTTANSLTRILHVLAEHPAEQEKLRAEVSEARHGNDIAYEALEKLPYLDAVCRETLRLYSPVNVIGRTSAKNMTLPLLTPVMGKDGSLVSEVAVPERTWILANIQASNCNRALWGEDAYEWKPERWLKPFPASLEDARIPGVYSNLLSFSGGSRSCIGFKFSQLEMKILLSILLSTFKFETTGRAITWNTSGVSYPTMGENSDKPELLLKVSKVA